MTLCDTGVLVNLVGVDKGKAEAAERALALSAKPLITTWPCITESMYLLGKWGGGWARQYHLSRLIQSPLLSIYEIQSSDILRLFSLMAQYQDRPMDLADASLVLAAEKTGDRQILTLDSDFFFYRINNRDSFDVLEI
jgi:uncharacterized protein